MRRDGPSPAQRVAYAHARTCENGCIAVSCGGQVVDVRFASGCAKGQSWLAAVRAEEAKESKLRRTAMRDILLSLPPTTPITGNVGDGGSYHWFDTTPGVARAAVTEAHRLATIAPYEFGPPDNRQTNPGHTPPPYFYHECTAVLRPKSSGRVGEDALCPHVDDNGVTLTLAAVNEEKPGYPDVRTDPWIVQAVNVEGFTVSDWNEKDPQALAVAIDRTREILAALEALQHVRDSQPPVEAWGWVKGAGAGWLLCPLVRQDGKIIPNASDVRGMIAPSPAEGGRLFAVRRFAEGSYSERAYADDMAGALTELATLMGEAALPPLPDGTAAAKGVPMHAGLAYLMGRVDSGRPFTLAESGIAGFPHASAALLLAVGAGLLEIENEHVPDLTPNRYRMRRWTGPGENDGTMGFKRARAVAALVEHVMRYGPNAPYGASEPACGEDE